ncbi:MAG: YlxM family DNA-binding protein [Oscillospiraceae bacterium]|nr:YlxM family DNA-binding protein [Oscillospiraceae bacterium]
METDTILRTMLFDYYGELLTEKQRECYDLHYNNDLTLNEVAESFGTSRQAVWDIVKRSEQIMLNYEEKTGLVARGMKRQKLIEEIGELCNKLPATPEKAAIIERLKELEEL